MHKKQKGEKSKGKSKTHGSERGAARTELLKRKSLELRVPNVYSDQITSIRSGVYAGLKKGRMGGFDDNRAH